MTSAPLNPRRALVFWTATGLIGAETILFTMVVPALPEFADRFGFSASVAALIFAAFPLGQLCSAFAAAGWVDRVGRRPVMVLALLALVAATLTFAFAGDTSVLAAARLAQGVATGLVWTAAIAAISDTYPDQLGFRIGLAETAGGAFGLLGPILGGALVDALGTRTTFSLAAMLPILALVPVLAMPETRKGATMPPPLLPALRRLAREPKARSACGSLGGLAAVLALIEPLLPLDLSERLGLSPFAIGLVFGTGLLAYFALVPVAGLWSDRIGRRAPTLIGGAVMTAGLPFLGVGSTVVVALAFAVVGAGMAGLGASSGALLVEATADAGMAGSHGLSAAVLTVIFAAGYAVGPAFGALARAALPFWAVTMVAAFASALLVAWLSRVLPRE